MTATDYNKWDKLDLDDDEDVSDCHPNIDGKLWLRLKKEKQWRKWQEEDEEAHAWGVCKTAEEKKLGDIQAEINRRTDGGFTENLAELRQDMATCASEMESLAVKLAKYEEKKKWRSSEVSQVDEASEVKTAERVALDRQDEIRKLSLTTRKAKAEEGKLAGTALFKQKKWAEARDAYSDGFDHVRMFDDPADMVAARDLRLSLALNLAAACLKTEEWGKAVGFAGKALEVEPDSVKALYRRGQGRIGTRDYEDAKKDLMRAAKLSPKDKAINKAAKQAIELAAQAARPKTEDEKADEYIKSAQENEAVYREFAYIRSDDASEEFINAHPELLTEHATGWMLLHCLELEMNGETAEMKKVARQNEMLEYIVRSCREVKIVDDPRAATMPFFRSIRADDDRARKGFEADMNGVIDKIRARAAQKKAQGESMPSAAGAAVEEEEIMVEKIEIEGKEYLVNKGTGDVFSDDGKGNLTHVGLWKATEVEGEGQVHLGGEAADPSKNMQIQVQ